MLQLVITYLLVAVAAAWVAWSVILPRTVKQALRARFAPRRTVPVGKDGCDCGKDGGCH